MSGQCVTFRYLGCGGNRNNFRTSAACRCTCQGQCNPGGVGVGGVGGTGRYNSVSA